MKNVALPFGLLLFAALACSSGKLISSDGSLTTPKAQMALNHWAAETRVEMSGAQAPVSWNDKPRPDLAVNGVRENPQDNTAIVDVQFTDFRYGRAVPDSYTGKGTAIFSHYTDGRWVLTIIQTPSRNWNNIRIEP